MAESTRRCERCSALMYEAPPPHYVEVSQGVVIFAAVSRKWRCDFCGFQMFQTHGPSTPVLVRTRGTEDLW